MITRPSLKAVRVTNRQCRRAVRLQQVLTVENGLVCSEHSFLLFFSPMEYRVKSTVVTVVECDRQAHAKQRPRRQQQSGNWTGQTHLLDMALRHTVDGHQLEGLTKFSAMGSAFKR
ncbi:hypothetical protein BaRGS_00002374 [Batillaria attramentaria]|uniref:Uncharacterized protein n=1 Tax=Batillaria attramentaria TaxID=370345 RepID=A0ABD0M4T5_9CAEN